MRSRHRSLQPAEAGACPARSQAALQVRAASEETIPPPSGKPESCKPRASGRARMEATDKLQLGPARGAAAAGLLARAEGAPEELQP